MRGNCYIGRCEIDVFFLVGTDSREGVERDERHC